MNLRSLWKRDADPGLSLKGIKASEIYSPNPACIFFPSEVLEAWSRFPSTAPKSTRYLISQGVCYLTLCEAGQPKKLAFSYLEELHAEFWELYGKKVPLVSRPYAFIEFGMC
uniref:Uncharacterized protein n=1 Tax=Sphaerodactylus townsendi TaxID=933632 RepID=A0ACB8ET73_9SAUR